MIAHATERIQRLIAGNPARPVTLRMEGLNVTQQRALMDMFRPLGWLVLFSYEDGTAGVLRSISHTATIARIRK